MPSRVLGNRASAQYSRCSKSARRARATPPSSLRWRASRRRAYSAARGASCFVPVYALTHIYSVAYTKGMGSPFAIIAEPNRRAIRSEEHTSELQSQSNLVCRLLLEKKKKCELIIRNQRLIYLS